MSSIDKLMAFQNFSTKSYSNSSLQIQVLRKKE